MNLIRADTDSFVLSVYFNMKVIKVDLWLMLNWFGGCRAIGKQFQWEWLQPQRSNEQTDGLQDDFGNTCFSLQLENYASFRSRWIYSPWLDFILLECIPSSWNYHCQTICSVISDGLYVFCNCAIFCLRRLLLHKLAIDCVCHGTLRIASLQRLYQHS